MFHNFHHTLTHLTRIAQSRQPEEGRKWLRDLFERDLEGLASVALDVAVETGDPIGQVLAGILRRKSLTPSLLQDLHAHLPDQSLALLEVAKIVTAQLLEHYRQQPGIRSQGRAANLTNDLAFRLAALGERKEALATARSAVRRFRRLARAQPRVFRPRLATALANLAENLLDCGRPKAALKAALQAEAIFVEKEELSTVQETHRAGVLLTRSRAYSDLGDHIAARKAAQQACDLLHALDQLGSGGYSHALAAAKHHLGLQQAQCGDLGASQETFNVYCSS